MVDFEKALGRLKRGLMTGNERTALNAYKEICGQGTLASSLIEGELRRFDLKTPLRKESEQLLAGLLALQRDLDEASSNKFIDCKLSHECPPVTAAILRSVRNISGRLYRKAAYGSISIWEHTGLDQGYEASKCVCAWLAELPQEDLSGISRIYILRAEFDKDWLGQYMPILGVVTISWTTIIGPASRLTRLTNSLHRNVLFHEVGHHVHEHWFGQDPEQEADANQYAKQAVYARTPLLARCALSVLGSVLRLFGRHTV